MLVGALGALGAVSPMATDTYLASTPAMAAHFGASASAVQLTLTSYMVGMALGQFLLGPVSDVLGRRRLVVAGFSCISASSFVVQNVLGYSTLGFSLVFAVNAGGSILGAVVSTRLVDSVEPGAVLRTALVVMAAVDVVGLGLVLAGVTGWTTLAHLFLSQSCIGFVLGNSVALAQSRVPGRGGAGSAVLGLVRFLTGGLVSPLP